MNWSPRWARPWYLRLRGKMRVSRTWHTELHGVRARCAHGVRNLRAIFAPASWKVATLPSSSEDSPAATDSRSRPVCGRLSRWRRCGRRPPGSSASEVRRAARAPAAAVARLVGLSAHSFAQVQAVMPSTRSQIRCWRAASTRPTARTQPRNRTWRRPWRSLARSWPLRPQTDSDMAGSTREQRRGPSFGATLAARARLRSDP